MRTPLAAEQDGMHRRNGFTLIELLIYTVIFSGMIGAVVFLTRTVQETRTRVRTSVILGNDLRFALNRITSYVRSADNINLPSTSTGVTLECGYASSSPGYNPTDVVLTNGIIQVTRGSSSTLAITSSAVKITSLLFDRTTSTPTAIRITMTGMLRNGFGASGVPQTLTGAAVMRR